ncbi:MAG: TM1812 family CRISPR-associated protein [Candidatus Bathyarchaeia archaeon]
MHYIIQIIGRFDYEEVNWVVKDEEYEDNEKYRSPLISYSIFNHYKKSNPSEDYEVMLLIPESLVTYVAKDASEAFDLLKNKDKLKEKFLNKIKESYSSALSNLKFDVSIIQSIGSYKSSASNRYIVRFENYVDNIVSYLLFDLINLKNVNGITFDVSTGLNINVCSMIEALKTLIVYHKLLKILQGGKGIHVKLAFAPPVAKELKDLSYSIELYTYDAKAFFDLPIKKSFRIDELTDLQEKKYKELSQSREKINKAISMLKLMFNIVKLNTPLALFKCLKTCDGTEIVELNDLLSLEELLSELTMILNHIKGETKVELIDDSIKVKYYKVNRNLLANVILSISLYSSLREFAFRVKEIKPSINQIKRLFSGDEGSEGIYKMVNLEVNKRFLERDLEDIKTKTKNLNIEEWALLKGLEKQKPLPLKLKFLRKFKAIKKKVEEGKNEKFRSNEKRNFFAHSGFLEKYTYVKKEGDEILLSYDCSKETIREIKSWINDPS